MEPRTRRCALIESNKTRRIAIGKRPDQGCIHECKDGHTRTHPKRKHQNRRAGEARIFAELSYGEADVEKQVFQERDSPAFTICLCGRFDTTQLEDCIPPRLLRGHACTQVVIDMHLQMAIELIGNLSLSPYATKHPRQPDKPCTQRLHAYSPLKQPDSQLNLAKSSTNVFAQSQKQSNNTYSARNASTGFTEAARRAGT